MSTIKKTLAIETSCDDTSIGIISYNGETFSVDQIVAYSQIEHEKYGGVVPEFAYRLHSEKIIALLGKIGKENIKQVDNISVTTHPGLPGALVIGKTVATMLSQYYQKPLIEVNHIHGHLLSIFLERKLSEIKFPIVVLSVSGGHNDLYLLEKKSEKNNFLVFDDISITKLGSTLDDAAGESFDKVARMLGGPYPGGKRISDLATLGKINPEISFKRIFLKSDEFNFSFSGMKAQVHFLLENYKEKKIPLTDKLKADIAYEFQEAVVETLAKKLLKAALAHEVKTIALVGGVSANDRLISYTTDLKNQKGLAEIPLLTPTKKLYCTDNSAMIGVVGLLRGE
ncbi:MAG TPA: tRNA (adenosine(37)-N6)-threonylcarbamoyltransferase complex transferase subunit TsaD [Candidatus Absconditabacterales bacterium]|nr:tRNA (adenosine(37)-N6)-threonylcarbamoyltransferase complex transferase subunit TsaD [Candidatus Absconditabacterales bacterium]HMT26914.1 tRNA (adenosine(37)-N6)-threonylcarbamoyltransferase complex transferase subunit TsaD [Candidatus Absconditabacterales bacterium]